MTATRGAGVIRFTVPRGGDIDVTVAFDQGYSKRLAAQWQASGDGDLRASFSAGTVCDAGAYHLHSATRVLHAGKPVTAKWRGGPGDARTTLRVRAGEMIELHTGLSTIDQRRFHDTLLDMGSVPLPSMEAEMLKWIAREKSR